jgi:hypothetical protein
MFIPKSWQLHIMKNGSIFFHSLCSLIWPSQNNEQVCAPLVSTMPFPANAAKFSLCKLHCHYFQTLYCRLHPSRLRIGENLRVLGWGCRLEGVTLPNHISWRLPESSNMWAALHCHAETRFWWDSCEAKLIQNTPQALSIYTLELTSLLASHPQVQYFRGI